MKAKLIKFIRENWESPRFYRKLLVSPLALLVWLKNGEIKRQPYEIFSVENKFIAILYYKCASTTIGHKLIKNRFYRCRQRYLKNKKDSFVFTFVRNPYKRVLAAYMDKVKKKADAQFDYKWAGALKHLTGKEIQFGDFVKLICKIPDHCTDPHLISYSYVLNDSKLKPDFIGKLENFDRDWKSLCKITGLPEFKKTETLRRNKGKYNHNLEKYYTKELKNLIYNRYQEDFKRFNYKK